MNWKCVLVGLALVLPGTLLNVEGRYFGESALSEQQFFDRLLKLKLDKQTTAKFNSERDANLHLQKKLSTNTNPAETVQKNEPAPTGEHDTAGPAKESAATSTGQHSGGGGEGINKAVERAPQTLRQRQAEGLNSGGITGIAPSDTIFIMVVAGCTVLAAIGIVGAGVCWYKYHKSAKAASVVEYPAYGVTGPTKDRAPSPGDRKLAHSAQMYHYQHQKQQMMAMQSATSGDMKHDASDDESVEDNDDADYTVYECPGLAPTGEMEVKNPLFRGDDTPSTPANDDTHPPPPEY